MIKIEKIRLDEVAKFIEPELIETAEPLDYLDYVDEPAIVAIDADGDVDLLDGYHRIAGLIVDGVSRCEQIEVIISDNDDLNQFVADKESGEYNEMAISLVQKMAKEKEE